MDKMRMETVNGIARNIEKIEELFPNCVTEARGADGELKKAINFDVLRQTLLGETTEEEELDEITKQQRERYDFTWVGKREALADARRSIRKTLRPYPTESRDWDTTQNLYIEGDNLEVLKLLQESYLGKVKVIYIDPPYNTGNDFIYFDDFTISIEEYEIKAKEKDSLGNRLLKNTNSNGRFHSDWCNMIYPRLLVARDLLSDDGCIFISIDDRELSNLRKICDEVLGAENFIAIFPWRKRTAKSDVPFGISQDFEWIICYAKTSSFVARIEGTERKYYQTEDFPGRPWRIHDLTTQRTAQERPNSNFVIVNPKTGEEYPANPLRTWAVTQETFKEYYADHRIVFPNDYDFLKIRNPMFRYWKSDDEKKAGEVFGFMPVSTKFPDSIGMSLDGTREVVSLLNGKIFSYPKPLSLLKYLIDIASKFDKEAVVLDFFSGSATTAHAVMQLNAERLAGDVKMGKRGGGGILRYIMVQLPEVCDSKSEARKAGYKNICEIGKERIRRAGNKIKSDNPLTTQDLDVGFRVFKVDESNMNDVYYGAAEWTQDLLSSVESNIKPDRSDLDLLFSCVLEWGLFLSQPYKTEQIDGFTVHNYNDGDLIACFEEGVSEKAIIEIARRNPLRAVFRDSCFKDSASKINLGEIFKRFAPDAKIKTL